jgi:hypothetical protein
MTNKSNITINLYSNHINKYGDSMTDKEKKKQIILELLTNYQGSNNDEEYIRLKRMLGDDC